MPEEDLIKMIKDCFHDVVYPGDDYLMRTDIYDYDVPKYYELLHGRSWEDVLEMLLKFELSELLFYQHIDIWMTAKARHYYMPTFLILILEYKADIFAENFIFSLKPRKKSELGYRQFTSLLKLLTTQQQKVVAMTVLKWCSDSEFFESTIQFWRQKL